MVCGFMNDSSDSPVAGLLKCFFSECEQKFRFLEQRYGFEYISGLAEYKNTYRIIKPYHDQEVQDPFLAMARYEKGTRAFEVIYGGEDMILEFHSCHDRILRFTPAEILAAARRYSGAMSGSRRVEDSGKIESILTRFSKALEKHPKILLDPPFHIIERAQSIRHKHLEQALRKHYRQVIDQACKQAARAYRERDFPKVVRILEPHKTALGSADLKKLHLARSQL